MSEPYAIYHACKCDKPKLGYINADTETVYCDYCEGVLGSLGDMHLNKMNEQEQLDNIQAQPDKTAVISRLTPMQKFEIKVPVWGGKKVGLASYKIAPHNSIEILAEDIDGNRIYPHPMYMSGKQIRTYPTEPVRRNPHIKLYIVPINDLELLERE